MKMQFGFVIAATFLMASGAFAQMGGMPGSGVQDFPGFRGHQMNMNLIIPQVAVGQNYQTTLSLLNLGDSSQMPWVTPQNLKTAGRISLFKQDGSPLVVSVGGSGPASQLTFSLDPSETANYALSYSGPDTSGWALIEVDDLPNNASWGMMDGQQMMRGERLMASVFYTYQNGATVSRVGVVPSMYQMGTFYRSAMPVQEQEGLYTGFALVNVGTEAVAVQLRLMDADGQLYASQDLSLPAGHQIAQFVRERFPGLPPGFLGFLEVITNSDGIVTMGLLEGQGVLTSIPTMHYGRISATMP